MSKKASFEIGKLADFENDPFSVEFAGIEQFPFLRASFDELSGVIVIDIDTNRTADGSIAPGDYNVIIVVKEDQNTQQFDFTVEILGFEDDKGDESQDIAGDDTDEEFTGLEALGQEELEKQLLAGRPSLQIKSISRFGVVKIEFSEPLWVSDEMLSINEKRMLKTSKEPEEQPILELSIEASDDDYKDFMGLKWHILQFNTNNMLVQLDLDFPAQIS